eukprot:9065831-Ditylum_brightwellii.AAC.1
MNGMRKGVSLSQDLGITPNYSAWGPCPLDDTVGFTIALQILQASVEPGNHSKDKQRFDTIRRS